MQTGAIISSRQDVTNQETLASFDPLISRALSNYNKAELNLDAIRGLSAEPVIMESTETGYAKASFDGFNSPWSNWDIKSTLEDGSGQNVIEVTKDGQQDVFKFNSAGHAYGEKNLSYSSINKNQNDKIETNYNYYEKPTRVMYYSSGTKIYDVIYDLKTIFSKEPSIESIKDKDGNILPNSLAPFIQVDKGLVDIISDFPEIDIEGIQDFKKVEDNSTSFGPNDVDYTFTSNGQNWRLVYTKNTNKNASTIITLEMPDNGINLNRRQYVYDSQGRLTYTYETDWNENNVSETLNTKYDYSSNIKEVEHVIVGRSVEKMKYDLETGELIE